MKILRLKGRKRTTDGDERVVGGERLSFNRSAACEKMDYLMMDACDSID